MRCRKANAGRLGIGQHRNAFRTELRNQRNNEIKEESALHDKVIAFCNRSALGYVHSRMDKRPTIRKGWPDFIVFRRHEGRTLVAFVELKTARGRLTKRPRIGDR
jgi:hypothetical protein